VDYNGSYWIPIETTRLGKNFMEAWQSGISEVRAAHDKDAAQFVRIVEAVEEYPPVTILESETHPTEFPKEKVAAAFTAVLAQLQKEKYETQIKRVKNLIKSDPENKSYEIELGMVYVEGGKSKEAVELFNGLVKDPSVDVQASAYNNLGNIAYLKGSYSEALTQYAEAAKLNAADGGIKINQARAAWRMQDDAGAKKFLGEAKEIMPEWREYVSDMPAELVR
jgi:tetratricopeptide (TPR) repeat protein